MQPLSDLIYPLISAFMAGLLLAIYAPIIFLKSSAALAFSSHSIHKTSTPRIGGIAILIGLYIGLLIQNINFQSWIFQLQILMGTPIFLIGLHEDIESKFSANQRLMLITALITTSIVICGLKINNVDLTWPNQLLRINFFATGFAIFASVGLINAYNIIDGLNGLSIFIAIMCLLSIIFSAYIHQDYQLTNYSLVILAAICGFAPLNIPFGKIFIGDCGAYLIGYLCATFSILLIHRIPTISPFYALLINIYPVTETIFSISRRKFITKTGYGKPDRFHLHTLVFFYLIKKIKFTRNKTIINILASFSIAIGNAAFLLTGYIFYERTDVLIFILSIYCVTYLLIYKKIVLELKIS
jgi:UDP-GlcNAc:undecaprenyl-phosphate/decaprenyl-phosphate GlcNAc-1-phosphate transferase